jgi:hypothetical protein
MCCLSFQSVMELYERILITWETGILVSHTNAEDAEQAVIREGWSLS